MSTHHVIYYPDGVEPNSTVIESPSVEDLQQRKEDEGLERLYHVGTHHVVHYPDGVESDNHKVRPSTGD